VRDVVIYPEPGYEGGAFLDVAPNNWHLSNRELVRQLGIAGYTVKIWPCEVDVDNDIGLALDHPRYPAKIPNLAMCVNLEPPVVYPRFFERINGWPYQRILTVYKPYVDDKRTFWSPFPIVKYDGPLEKHERYLCAISSGDKLFDHPDALYEARRQCYLSFGKDIDLYGWGWQRDTEIMDRCNYIGPVDNKVLTLSKYKFAIVFENQVLPGWTSEKYWDCIQAGTVPIYRGSLPDYPMERAMPVEWAKGILEHLWQLSK
jgi:hypothetical protein